jgi:hypothetical protein
MKTQIEEHYNRKVGDYNKREEQWKLEKAKMKEIEKAMVIETEKERQNNKRMFSFDGQQTFDKQRKEIATLQSALANKENDLKDLNDLIQKMKKDHTE